MTANEKQSVILIAEKVIKSGLFKVLWKVLKPYIWPWLFAVVEEFNKERDKKMFGEDRSGEGA